MDGYAGTGLAAALEGADAVVDSSNSSSTDGAAVLDFFATSTRNLRLVAAGSVPWTILFEDGSGPAVRRSCLSTACRRA